MNERRETATKIIIILIIFQAVFIGRFVIEHIEDPSADSSSLFPLLNAVAIFLLIRLYVLNQPRKASRRSVSSISRSSKNTSIHGLSLGDIVFIRHLEMNAKIERIHEDDTYEVKTLLNKNYTVDIGMIEFNQSLDEVSKDE